MSLPFLLSCGTQVESGSPRCVGWALERVRPRLVAKQSGKIPLRAEGRHSCDLRPSSLSRLRSDRVQKSCAESSQSAPTSRTSAKRRGLVHWCRPSEDEHGRRERRSGDDGCESGARQVSACIEVLTLQPRAAPARAPRLSRHASPATFAHHGAAGVNQPPNNASAPAAPPPASMAQRPGPAVASSQPPPTFPYNSAHVYQPAPRQSNAQHAAYRPPQPTHQQPAQSRPLGRTVPTTSDLFDSGRKDALPASMAWNKPDARPPNGHAHTPLTPASAAIPGSKADERATRFPGLSEYLNSSKQAMASMPGLPHSHAQTQSALGLGLSGGASNAQNGSAAAGANANINGNATSAALTNGGGPSPVSAAPPAAGTTAPSYASMLTAGGKVLSPPKAGTTSLLGTFGGESERELRWEMDRKLMVVRPAGPFGQTPGAPAASATTAGTNAGRS